MTDKKPNTSIRTGKVIVLGCYPPRKCGIATFTRDTVESLLEFNPASEITVIAMAEAGDTAVAGGAMVRRIHQHDLGSYIDAASLVRVRSVFSVEATTSQEGPALICVSLRNNFSDACFRAVAR